MIITSGFFKDGYDFLGLEIDDFLDSALSNVEMWVINIQGDSFEHIFNLIDGLGDTIDEVLAIFLYNLELFI